MVVRDCKVEKYVINEVIVFDLFSFVSRNVAVYLDVSAA